MNSLAELKASSQKTLQTLVQESQKSKFTSNDDDRFWQPTVDSAGNAKAVIRFLPAKQGEKMPWVNYFEFAFQVEHTGKWYFERSLQSLGQKDPCAEYKNKIWNTDNELAKTMKRKQYFISNILVVNDPANPENNGKVFLFRYGKQIYDKIQAVLFPEEGLGEQPNDPTDFWHGQNFNIIIGMQGTGNQRFRTYANSKFVAPSQVAPTDEEIEKLWASQHSLNEQVAPSTFKTYDELKARLEICMNGDDAAPVQARPSTFNRPTSREEAVNENIEVKSVDVVEQAVKETPKAVSINDLDIDALVASVKSK